MGYLDAHVSRSGAPNILIAVSPHYLVSFARRFSESPREAQVAISRAAERLGLTPEQKRMVIQWRPPIFGFSDDLDSTLKAVVADPIPAPHPPSPRPTPAPASNDAEADDDAA